MAQGILTEEEKSLKTVVIKTEKTVLSQQQKQQLFDEA